MGKRSKSQATTKQATAARRPPPHGREADSGPAEAVASVAETAWRGRGLATTARLVGAQAKIQGRLPILLLTGVSLAACCLMFPPVEWWPLGYVCLVPWLFCVCTARKSRFVYLASLLLGLGFFLILLSWLIHVTIPGYVALCAISSIFFPLVAWPIRHMYRRHGVSVALIAPVVWVAAEYLRSISALGFPFLLLGHSQYKILTMIQISDLVGAYGVSFMLAMVNGWITDLLIQPILIRRSERGTRLPVGSLATLLVVLGTAIYGSAQGSRRFFRPGPKVAVIQHDFPMFVAPGRSRRTGPETLFRAYLELARQAAAEKPDLIVLPETAMSCFINDEFVEATPADVEEIWRRRFPYRSRGFVKAYQRFSREVRDAFQELSTQSGVPIILGSASLEWRPKAIPPGVEAFNSAFLLLPGEARPVARYDKIHLVLFGEYVPFRTSYRPLYDWLNSMTPWGRAGIEYSLTPGSEYTVFEFQAASQQQRRYRAAVPICYEEVMPYIARRFTRGNGEALDQKNIDMLLTISNDGWFLHSAELKQHLATAVFRAIENRIAVARSVNTGASAQIHPNGKIHDYVVLSEEHSELLEPVVAALRRLDALAGELDARVQTDDAYRTTFEKLSRVFLEDLRATTRAVGAEFTFIDERLGPLLYELTAKRPESRQEAVHEFRGQLEEDLDMIARWRDKPWTAPGYIIADMQCDDRVALYMRWGDWFAQGMVALFAVMLLDWLWRRILRRRAEATKSTDLKGSSEER